MDVIPITEEKKINDSKSGDFNSTIEELREIRKEFKKYKEKSEIAYNDLDTLIRLSKEVTKNSFQLIDLINKLRDNQDFIPECKNVLKNLEIIEKTVKREKIRFQSEFINELTKELEKIDIQLSGASPNFFIKPFNLITDFKFGTGKLLFGQEKIELNIPLRVNKIISEYKKNYKTICGRNFDEDKFLETLYQAYLRVLKLNDSKLNKKANIREVYEEFVFLNQSANFRKFFDKRYFNSYPITYFLFDLRSCKKFEFGNQKLSLTTATIDATNKKNSVLLPDLEGKKEDRYIMALEFLEKKK